SEPRGNQSNEAQSSSGPKGSQNHASSAVTVKGLQARNEGAERALAYTLFAVRSARRLSDYALASRLSYFLWSSMPDAELLARAAAGELHRPAVLLAQTRRMLRDDRIRGLAIEFAGNWLDFRRFEEHNAVDRARFPGFTDELRRAM